MAGQLGGQREWLGSKSELGDSLIGSTQVSQLAPGCRTLSQQLESMEQVRPCSSIR